MYLRLSFSNYKPHNRRFSTEQPWPVPHGSALPRLALHNQEVHHPQGRHGVMFSYISGCNQGTVFSTCSSLRGKTRVSESYCLTLY